jgi:putative addiction module component (TIGR02574 family)
MVLGCLLNASLEVIMAEILDTLEAQVLGLPLKQRSELFRRLMVSLDDEPLESPEVIAKAWDEEIRRRVAAMDAGTVKLIPVEEVFAGLEAIANGDR